MAVVTTEMGFGCKLVEEVAAPFGAVNTFDYSLPDLLILGGAATTPVLTQVWSGILALVAGTLTIDLQVLTRTGRSNLSLDGLSIFGYRVDNLGAAALTFIAPVADDYPMFPATPGLVVGIGASVQMWVPGGFGVVGAAASDITVTGTGTDTFRLALWAGTAS